MIKGKMILIQPGLPDQEYKFAKRTIKIGRAETNDIVLTDGRVSRSHARLDIDDQDTVSITDLGSSNGTLLNGLRVERSELQAGDSLSIGGNRLRYEIEQAIDEPTLLMIESDAQLEQTIDLGTVPVSLNEQAQPHLVVMAPQGTREVPLIDKDNFAIGRSDDNDLVIEHVKVSRHHAEINYRAGNYILKDLSSTNGTWINAQPVEQVFLQNGDTFSIGNTRIIYKSGFIEEALTIADRGPRIGPGKRLVVIVPGIMGSELWLGNERIWPDVKTLFRNPEIFRYPSDLPIEPRGIVDEVVIVPNLIKQDQYNRLGDYLVENLGYNRGDDLIEFGYDWRQDVRISAKKLGEAVERLPKDRPVVIIAHSLGTMVSRYYVEHYGGRQRVERLILMGGPHRGAVKALTSLLVAPQLLPFGIMGERMREILATFPASYQILPTNPVVIDRAGTRINFLEDEDWLGEKQIPLLRLAREFRRELGTRVSIPSVSIFGYGIKTISDLSVNRDSNGKINNIDYQVTPTGDSAVVESSAVCEGTEIHPVQQYHGSLFVDNDVKMRLKLELTRPYSS